MGACLHCQRFSPSFTIMAGVLWHSCHLRGGWELHPYPQSERQWSWHGLLKPQSYLQWCTFSNKATPHNPSNPSKELHCLVTKYSNIWACGAIVSQTTRPLQRPLHFSLNYRIHFQFQKADCYDYERDTLNLCICIGCTDTLMIETSVTWTTAFKWPHEINLTHTYTHITVIIYLDTYICI